MNLIEDSRQKPGKHAHKNEWWREHGVRVLRCKISFGDYCLSPAIAVDTKAGVEEIAGNIGGNTAEHHRFREEFKLAREYGCKLVFLIENTEGITCIEDVEAWENPRRQSSPKAIDGPRLSRTMATIEERYGCQFRFCESRDSGRVIQEILEEQEPGMSHDENHI